MCSLAFASDGYPRPQNGSNMARRAMAPRAPKSTLGSKRGPGDNSRGGKFIEAQFVSSQGYLGSLRAYNFWKLNRSPKRAQTKNAHEPSQKPPRGPQEDPERPQEASLRHPRRPSPANRPREASTRLPSAEETPRDIQSLLAMMIALFPFLGGHLEEILARFLLD